MFSITYDPRFADSASAYLIRPADGSAAVYRAAAVVRLPDGRELRANFERTRGAGPDGKAADSVVFYRNGRRCPEAHYSAARDFALAAFRRLYQAALAVDFDQSAPGWPSINDGQTQAELNAERSIGYAKRNAEAARARALADDAGRSAFDPARPFRAYNRTPQFSGCFDFATLEEARAYLSAQIARRDSVVSGAAPVGPDSNSQCPMESFIAWPEGTETLADMGWTPPTDGGRRWKAPEAAAPVDPAPVESVVRVNLRRQRDGMAAIADAENPATVAIARQPETVAIEMNWRAASGIILAALENGTGTGRRMAREELQRMAETADGGNAARRALLALATVANETAHCLGQPGSMARDEMDSAIAAAFALLTGEAPPVDPLRDVAALAEYRMAGRGATAAGAIVLRRLPDDSGCPFVVHFRNDADSVRAGRPAYYHGDYCATLAEAWAAFADKVRRYDSDGSLEAAFRAASKAEAL